jgi:ADP-ribose pyrophosphatase YjhB (NUDIX family)
MSEAAEYPKRDRLYPERPIPGCLAVVRRGDKVLLAERSHPPAIGKWGFPGGMIELGETILHCAQRELLEETGIAAEPLRVLTAFEVLRRDDTGKVQTHFTLVCVLLDWRAGDGEPIEDATRVGWFSLAEAASLDCFPDTLPVMRLVLK